ncbi:hypothetical protein C8R48DRAFT_697873 [Suillus tomentosus]|nr:hypothetical protein C8R48DRAFT_697873 [Suillus tomentosus]
MAKIWAELTGTYSIDCGHCIMTRLASRHRLPQNARSNGRFLIPVSPSSLHHLNLQ